MEQHSWEKKKWHISFLSTRYKCFVRARGVGWKGRISAADVNLKIGLRDWPTSWSVPVLAKPGSCLVLFFYCLFAYPRDTKVRIRLNVSARSRSNWNFEVLVSQEEDKTRVPGENPFGAKMRTNNKLNPHMASTPGNKPAPHWWVASTLITRPPLLHPLPPPPCLNFRASLARER